MFLSVNPQEHPRTAFPEPPIQMRTLQSAPPSYRDRIKPVHPNNSITNTMGRALSVPSNLDAAEHNALSVDYEERLNSKSPFGSLKERQNPNPQPLSLPLPQNATVLKNSGKF